MSTARRQLFVILPLLVGCGAPQVEVAEAPAVRPSAVVGGTDEGARASETSGSPAAAIVLDGGTDARVEAATNRFSLRAPGNLFRVEPIANGVKLATSYVADAPHGLVEPGTDTTQRFQILVQWTGDDCAAVAQRKIPSLASTAFPKATASSFTPTSLFSRARIAGHDAYVAELGAHGYDYRHAFVPAPTGCIAIEVDLIGDYLELHMKSRGGHLPEKEQNAIAKSVLETLEIRP